jgi:hypothetical protein
MTLDTSPAALTRLRESCMNDVEYNRSCKGLRLHEPETVLALIDALEKARATIKMLADDSARWSHYLNKQSPATSSEDKFKSLTLSSETTGEDKHAQETPIILGLDGVPRILR